MVHYAEQPSSSNRTLSSSNSILASQAETTVCINVPIEVYRFAFTNFISFVNFSFLQKTTTGMLFNHWNA